MKAVKAKYKKFEVFLTYFRKGLMNLKTGLKTR